MEAALAQVQIGGTQPALLAPRLGGGFVEASLNLGLSVVRAIWDSLRCDLTESQPRLVHAGRSDRRHRGYRTRNEFSVAPSFNSIPLAGNAENAANPVDAILNEVVDGCLGLFFADLPFL